MADKKIVGTHEGHLGSDVWQRRVAKNARNRSRRGQASRAPGSDKRVHSRLFKNGGSKRGR